MRPGSAGLPLPGHAFKIIDDTGKEVKTGEAGTLVITKPFPSLARSIWNDHNKYINQYFSVFPNFYCTYDSAIKDKFGHIWVIGRTDDVINVSGHRISTMEMENSIMSVPDISEAAVIGIDHEIKGTVPYVFFTSKNTDNELKNKISSAIESSIGRFAMPEKIIIIPEMPKTRSGKIMRRLLKEIVMHGDVSGDITGLENPDSINIIKNAINNQK